MKKLVRAITIEIYKYRIIVTLAVGWSVGSAVRGTQLEGHFVAWRFSFQTKKKTSGSLVLRKCEVHGALPNGR